MGFYNPGMSTGGAGGTVNSLSAGNGITLTPNPIVNAGTIAVDATVVALLGTAQAFTGRKTFPAAGANAAIIPAILGGGAGTNGHVVPNVADDIFTLNLATQTLQNKSMSGALNSFSAIPTSALATPPTLQNDYTTGGAGGGVIGLTAAGGGIIVRDNATPIGGNLLAVTDSTGGTVFFAVTASAGGATVLTLSDGAAASVSAASKGNLIYNDTLKFFRVSMNGSAYDTLMSLTATQEATNKTLTGQVIKNGLSATGSTLNDFSGSTGGFTFPTGPITWNGAASQALALTGASTFTFTSGITMSGSAVAFTVKSSNSWTAGDKLLSAVVNATEVWRLQNSSNIVQMAAIGNFGGQGEGPNYAVAVGGTSGTGFTGDATAQTSGRKWSWLAIGNLSTSGARAAGDWVIQDVTGSSTLFVLKSAGRAYFGDNTSSGLANSGVAVQAVTLGAMRNNLTTTVVVGISAFNASQAVVGTQRQDGPVVESLGSVWDTGAAAVRNCRIGFKATGVNANPATVNMDFVKAVATGDPTPTVFLTLTDAAVFKNITGITLQQAGQNLGFYGTVPVAQQASGANLTNNVTAGGTTDQVDDFSVTVGIDLINSASQPDVNARLTSIRNDIYQLARKLKQVNDGLRAQGLLT